MENKTNETAEVLEVGRVLISAVSSQINGEIYNFPENTDFEKLYKLAERHKVTPFAAPSVIASNSASEEIKQLFKKQLFRCAARHAAQEKEAEELSRLFSEHRIRHCFLKGFKVSKYYDNPDMRFMLDMDIYIESGKSEEAKKILTDRGYEYSNFEDAKDVGYTKKPFLNVELHKELKYDYDKGYNYYKGAFERMTVSENGYTVNMTDEDFYVYILSHAAHHFESAGTGIKTVIDHYYLLKKLKPACDDVVLKKALDETGLAAFSEKSDKLARCWFDGEKPNSFVEETTDYIILSGVFGTSTNYYLSGIIRGEYTEKKSSYFLTRIFLPLDLMKKRYPILKKCPFLLPLMWAVRIVTSFSNGKKYADEVKTVNSVDKDEMGRQIEFLKRNGL